MIESLPLDAINTEGHYLHVSGCRQSSTETFRNIYQWFDADNQEKPPILIAESVVHVLSESNSATAVGCRTRHRTLLQLRV